MVPWASDYSPEAAVFIDVESVIGSPTNSQTFLDNVQKKLESIRAFEAQRKVILTSIRLFARQRKHVSLDSQKALRALLQAHKAEMFWVCVPRNKKRNAADKKIISEIREKLRSNTLPEVMLLLSNDSDFCHIARMVRLTSRYVIVSGSMVGQRLQKEADLVVSL